MTKSTSAVSALTLVVSCSVAAVVVPFRSSTPRAALDDLRAPAPGDRLVGRP